LLSLLALKLTATRRVSHVDDLLTDPAPALLAGLSVLPKKTALTDYSYRLSHDHQQRFLAALDAKMIASGLAASDEAIFDLDIHARGVKCATRRMRSPSLIRQINALTSKDFKQITISRSGRHNKPKVAES